VCVRRRRAAEGSVAVDDAKLSTSTTETGPTPDAARGHFPAAGEIRRSQLLSMNVAMEEVATETKSQSGRDFNGIRAFVCVQRRNKDSAVSYYKQATVVKQVSDD